LAEVQWRVIENRGLVKTLGGEFFADVALCGHGNHCMCCRIQPLRHSSQILRGRCQQKLISSATESSQPQAIQLQNPLEMREQHFDFLPILARLLVTTGLRDIASDIPR
jgi:hypothetical protein